MKKKLQEKLASHLGWMPTRRPTLEEARLYFLVVALAGEAGELANFIKKKWRDDKFITNDAFLAAVKKELADIGNYTYMTAKLLDYDLEEGMLEKILEVEARPSWIIANEKRERRAASAALRSGRRARNVQPAAKGRRRHR